MSSKILFRIEGKDKEKEYLINEVVVSDKEISAKESLLTLATKNNIVISNFCNGMGNCGRCKVIVDLKEQEKLDLNNEVISKVLKQEQILKGYILACLAFPKNNSNIEVIVPSESIESKYEVLSGKAIEIKRSKEISGDAGVVIDIGTTTVASYLVDLASKDVVDSEGSYNGQVRFGADVMTRMNYIFENNNGAHALQDAIVSTINTHLRKFSERKKFQKISKIVASGNTVMTYLFLKKNPLEIRYGACDNPNFKKPYIVKGRDVNLKYSAEDADVYCVAGLGSYVGGDITSDIIVSKIFNEDKIGLVIDVGTNGEIALGNKEWLAVCATSAGPAFEGGEVRCGMRAMKGAIDRIKINNNGGEVIYRVIGNDIPKGICGSGLIILIAELMRNKLIDTTGKFNRKLNSKRIRKSKFYEEQGQEVYEYVVVYHLADARRFSNKFENGNETESTEDITINEKDLENLKYTKAAIFSGVNTLLRNTGVKLDEISQIFIAGGFGNFLDLESAILVGLFPDVEREKYKFIGNGSLDGAYKQLIDGNAKKTAEDLALNVTYVDLSKDGNFVDEYSGALYFPHSRLDLFPTWKNFELGIEKTETKEEKNEKAENKEKVYVKEKKKPLEESKKETEVKKEDKKEENGLVKAEKKEKAIAKAEEKPKQEELEKTEKTDIIGGDKRHVEILKKSKMYRIDGFKIEADELEVEM
ncbi:MAG: ASKHA domain-containing protein [Candidatus Altarchaeum sp.]|nr:ASKHA domain-containing protein [Candidatus Altarchaeum sp.]